MRIGTDIIEINRIATAVAKDSFRCRVFTAAEQAYCLGRGKQSDASFAGIYAAKEAFVKALGTGFRHGTWQDMEVYHDDLGAPKLRVSGVFGDLAAKAGVTAIELSISHCRDYATATVLLV